MSEKSISQSTRRTSFFNSRFCLALSRRRLYFQRLQERRIAAPLG
jgi:hypothetical protein